MRLLADLTAKADLDIDDGKPRESAYIGNQRHRLIRAG